MPSSKSANQIVFSQPETFKRYAGAYQFNDAGSTTVGFSFRDGRYWFGRTEMVPVGGRLFVIPKHGDQVEFLSGRDGRAAEIRYGKPNFQPARARRLPDPVPLGGRIEEGGVHGVVSAIGRPWGNLATTILASDLAEVGIEPGDLFRIRIEDHSFEIRYGESFDEVEPGHWIALEAKNGSILLARRDTSPLELVSPEPGDPVFVVKGE